MIFYDYPLKWMIFLMGLSTLQHILKTSRTQSKQLLCVTRKEELNRSNIVPHYTRCRFRIGFINGFHDTANAVATSVSTRALKPRTAVYMTAVMNFIGALTFTGVAKTISKDIVDPFVLDNGALVILAALTTAIA